MKFDPFKHANVENGFGSLDTGGSCAHLMQGSGGGLQSLNPGRVAARLGKVLL